MNELARKKKKGFTLIELIAVIAIIGILAAVLVPKVLGYMNDAKRSKIIGQCRTFVMAVETYNSKEITPLGSLGAVVLDATAGGGDASASDEVTLSTLKDKLAEDNGALANKYKDYFDVSNLDMLSDTLSYENAKIAANGRDEEGNVRTIDIDSLDDDGQWSGIFVEDEEAPQ